MNVFYDFEDAGARLNAQFAKSSQEQGTAVFLPLMDTERVQVEEFTNPPCLRLICKPPSLESEPDVEVEVKIPGILCRSMLPPFTRHISSNDKATVRGLRQYVKVTGMGNHHFELMRGKLAEVEQMFGKVVGGVKSLNFNEYDGEYAIDAHCHYFTDRRVDPTMKHERFSSLVDPEMKLELARGDDFVHGQENIVQYLKEVVNSEGRSRYEEVSPGAFRNGDLVDLQVAFICYPLHEGGYKIVPTLRSLIMISSTTREAAAKQMQALESATVDAVPITTSGKRKRAQGERGKKVMKRRFMCLDRGEDGMDAC